MEFVQPPLPRGNSEQQTYEGKNLWIGGDSVTTNGITFTKNNDGSYNISGTATALATCDVSVDINKTGITNGETYTISANQSIPTGLAVNFEAFNGDTWLRHILYNANIPNTHVADITDATKIRYRLRVNSGTTVNVTNLKIQIEQGSTATDYEPYVGGTTSPNPSYPQAINNVTGDVEVLDQNTNLFDKDDVINAYLNADGTTTSNNTFRVSNYINVKGLDNITISGNYGGSEYCCFYDKNKDFISNFGMGSLTTRTASVPSNAEYIRVTVRQDVLNEYQLQKGSTATTYTQHKEQTFTFPLGTQRMYLGDYLADDGIHHVRGQVTFDGSQDETWWIRSDTHEIRTGMLSSYNAVSGSDILCNQLIQVNSATAGANGVRWVLNSQDICIHSNDINTSTMTIEQWREHLNANPLTIEFGISTEIVTPYTTQQQTVYNAIKQALSYEEQTNISGSSDEANPIFNIEAYQSIKLVLQEISNAVVALGGV